MTDLKSDSSATRRARGRPRAWDDKTEQNTIKSLDRAMAVFEHLSTQSGVSLSALSDQLGESTATLYRILFTLETRGLVEFDQAQQLWHIGPGAFIIGARFLRRTSLVERARPVLRSLMEQRGKRPILVWHRQTRCCLSARWRPTKAFAPSSRPAPCRRCMPPASARRSWLSWTKINASVS